jgi:hypothetical protein
VVPYKHVNALVIGETLHAVLVGGRSIEEAADGAAVSQQTVRNWLTHFGVHIVAHLLEHLPRLGAPERQSADVPPVPDQRPAPHPKRDRLLQAWCVMLALAASRLRCAPGAVHPQQVLVELQPALAQLRPPAGVFRVPLHERGRARGPPRSG